MSIISPEQKQPAYSLSLLQVQKQFATSTTGLSEDEAGKRQTQFGLNQLEKKQDWFWLTLLVNQFNNALVWILLVASLLAYGFGEYRDMTIILIIVLLNAGIGFFQEFKAERILQKIKDLTTDKAIVVRGGEKREIESTLLVPGDVVMVIAGDNVPADGYVIEEYDLYVNDFIFTGESSPNKKSVGVLKSRHLHLGEMSNMVFMGSMVTRGEGLFIVTGTGMRTELGKIADKAAEIHADETPLQQKMRNLGRQVSIVAILIAVIVIFVGRYLGLSWFETFLFALALSVSVVPEGLPAALSVALSLGMKRLLKSNVLAKRLTAVETLGSVSVICTDKTGTITRNELMVTDIIVGIDTHVQVNGEGFMPKGDFFVRGMKIDPGKKKYDFTSQLERLCKIGVLCNDAQLRKQKGAYTVIGDPTEGAIIVAAKKYQPKSDRFFTGEKKLSENPFSSDRMRMSVVYQNSETVSYVKGSPDILLERCSQWLDTDGVKKLTQKDRTAIKAMYNSMSARALRVLAFAYRDVEGIDKKDYTEEAEKNLVWVGMMGMIDPPRRDVASAIANCRSAGIQVIMITGDYEVTARAIAVKVGLLANEKDGTVISGRQLQKMSDEAILDKVKTGKVVFARINPEQKLRIASILKKDSMIIAMTGDGVNDALALKRADIGVAMGQIGTDVSKEAGDMILLDDNFASIVKAIREGRVIYQNIKKFVHYVFTSNASELITVVLGVLLQIPVPLTAIQILATDLGTDLFPSLALGLDPAEPNAMKKKPYSLNEPVVTKRGFFRIVYMGAAMAVCAVATFVWSMMRGGWTWGAAIDVGSVLYIKSTTATYAVISMTQMANLFQSRSEHLSAFAVGLLKNRYAVGAFFISVLMLLAFMHVPVLQYYLKLSPIDALDWLAVAGSVLVVFFLEELRKAFVRRSLGR